MQEQDEERQTPRTLKEYLSGSKEAIDVFRWIFREVLTAESKKWLMRMFASIAFMTVMQTLQPGAVSYIFNGLDVRDSILTICSLGAFLALLTLQKIGQRWYDRAREYVVGIHWQQIDDRLTALFFEKSLAQHAEHSNLLSPTNIDKGKWRALDIQRMLFFDGIPTLIQLFFALICLSVLNWVAGLGMLSIMAIYVVWSLYLNSIIAKECHPLDQRFRKIGRRRNERFEKVERVKVCGKEENETREMSQLFAETIKDDRDFWLGFFDIAFLRSIKNAFGLVAVMSWGTWLVWKDEMSLGLLFPLFMWAGKVSENIWRLGDIEQQINWNLPPVKSTIAAMSIPPSIVDSENAVDIDTSVPHKIEFVGVSHSYPPESSGSDSPPAISNVSFTIEPGQKVALLALSGGGKSTLMRKLLRCDDPTAGKILINGIDLREITQASWKRGIGYIAQQAQVFDGTIRSNLTYGMEDDERAAITDEELWRVMKLLQIDFGERLVNGLDTPVGKGGIKLSGGQAQRLMIGAAVVKHPWLLVVDEATSSLDSTTEKLVQRGLETVLEDCSTSALIVAHRLSTVRYLCDKFVVLRQAKDVKPGESQVEAIADSFEELYAISPTFRQLADDQGIEIQPWDQLGVRNRIRQGANNVMPVAESVV